MADRAAPLRGRQAQAAHNDELILRAAREVFLADPNAPISAVAERAGVGIGALYHRYAGKEDLLRLLCRNGQEIYLTEIRRALASEPLNSKVRRIGLLPYDWQQVLAHRVQSAPRGARSHRHIVSG